MFLIKFGENFEQNNRKKLPKIEICVKGNYCYEFYNDTAKFF